MLARYAFWLAGGAGGVDDVGEGVGCGVVGGVVGRLVCDLVPVAGEVDGAAGVVGGEALLEVLLGEEYGGVGVGEHEGEPLGGVVGVERDVGAAGFEDAEQADHHFEAAFDADADEDFGADAELAEVVGELVRVAVELGVAERAVFEDDRGLVGGALGLGFDELVEAVLARVVAVGVVPVDQQLLALGLG